MSKPETPCLPGCRRHCGHPTEWHLPKYTEWPGCGVVHIPNCPNAPKAEASLASKEWCEAKCRCVCGHSHINHRPQCFGSTKEGDFCRCLKFVHAPACPNAKAEASPAPTCPNAPKAEAPPAPLDKNHAFQVDREFYPVGRNEMTGRELMGLLSHPADRELWQRGVGAPDRKIAPDDVVVVSAGCRFYSAPKYINSNHSEQLLNMVESAPPGPPVSGPRTPEWNRALLLLNEENANLAAERDALKAQNATLTAELERLRENVGVKYGATGMCQDRHQMVMFPSAGGWGENCPMCAIRAAREGKK